jgi:hypothetical protein
MLDQDDVEFVAEDAVEVDATPVPKKPQVVFGNDDEKRKTDELLLINLNDVELELASRVVVQSTSNLTGTPAHNISARNVLITDHNGDYIQIDNKDEVLRQAKKNEGTLYDDQKTIDDGNSSSNAFDESFDDEVDFD